MKLKVKTTTGGQRRLFLPGCPLVWLPIMLLLGSMVGAVSWGIRYYQAQRYDAQEKALAAAAELLHKIWHGDLSTIDYARKAACVGDRRPMFDADILQCLFTKHPYLPVARGKQVKVLPNFTNRQGQKLFYALHTKANTSTNFLPHYHFILSYGHLMDVLLEIPRDTYLPERIYAYGPQGSKKDLRLKRDWSFDNFGLRIFIDRQLVSFREIKHWVDFTEQHPLPANFFAQQTLINQQAMDTSWDYPAFGLTPAQMQAYCQFWGGELLRTEWFDAGSFHPGDYANPRPNFVLRKKYPWNRMPEKLNCELLFSAECRDQPYSVYHKSALSWIGLQQTLGGISELMQDISGNYVIKASSYLLSRASPWHELGKRWPYDPTQKQELGFRCMYYE